MTSLIILMIRLIILAGHGPHGSGNLHDSCTVQHQAQAAGLLQCHIPAVDFELTPLHMQLTARSGCRQQSHYIQSQAACLHRMSLESPCHCWKLHCMAATIKPASNSTSPASPDNLHHILAAHCPGRLYTTVNANTPQEEPRRLPA
jgi:hypothetical protein